MADLNDPGEYRAKFEDAKSRLDTADIDEKDRQAIKTFVERREASDKYEYSSLEQTATVLKRAAELAHKPLTQWEHDEFTSDYSQFMLGLKEGTLDGAKDSGYSEDYRRSFRQVLRVFYKHFGKDWAEEIKIGQPSRGEITEEDCFTSDETARMFQEADVRDSAIIALWLATGQRASAVASLKLNDVEMSDQTGRFMINPEAVGLKGAKGYRPMLWATPYMARWLDKHPGWPDPDPDTPLFITKRNGADYDKGDALSYDGLRGVVRSICDKAGIDSSKANTHRFRHTAIRRMVRDGLSEQRIKYMVGWHEDTQQLARYGNLDDESHASDIEEHYGLDPHGDDEDNDTGHVIENCPRCDMALSQLTDAQFCPKCGLPLKHSTRQVEEAVDDSLWQSKADADDYPEERGVDTARQIIEENEEAKAAVLDDLKDELLDDLRGEM